MEISRQEISWGELPFPPPGYLPDPGIKPMSLKLSALAGRFFTNSATWEALYLFSSVQLLSCVWFFGTPWTAAWQASLPITNSRSLLKLTSIESVMPSNHLILCHPVSHLPSIFPSIRVFSNESALRIRWPSIGVSDSSISPSNEYSYAVEFFIMAVSLDLLWQTLQAVCKGILLNLLMISHLECVQS